MRVLNHSDQKKEQINWKYIITIAEGTLKGKNNSGTIAVRLQM